LFDRAGGAALASRLSGLLIGEELRAQALPPGQPVTVLGSAALAPRYQRALAASGHPVRLAPDDATWHGLLAVARGRPAWWPGRWCGWWRQAHSRHDRRRRPAR
jgi:2-dehydro-3-deoxygalactonokinase